MSNVTTTGNPPQKRTALSRAVAVSDRVSGIEDIRFLESHCRLDADAARGEHQVEFAHQVESSADEANKTLRVIVTFKMTGYRITKKSKRPSVTIGCKLLLKYKITSLEGLGEDNFTQFARFNGIYNAWPYWREFVQSMIARMGLPPLVVPVFQLSSSRRPAE